MSITIPKKLIEVALPLDNINAACSYEKQPGIGAHPRGLHWWWARRPLAAARAVIFAQMVNDPSWKWIGSGRENESQIKATCARQREKLFDIIRDLVKWENTNNEEVLNQARAAIKKSWEETCEANKDHPQAAELFNPEKLPAFHDPFAGGGALPLEAQRLGLESYASDLNPVAVMINKAMIEIPPKFAGQKPVGPIPETDKQDKKRATQNVFEDWSGAKGLVEDVRRYGNWMREEAFKRIGHLYPQVEITPELAQDRPDLQDLIGEKLTVIAWLWARTVKSPNPAFSHVEVPLASSFLLSSKKGKEAYVEPIVDGDRYYFTVKVIPNTLGMSHEEKTAVLESWKSSLADAKKGTKLSRGANFRCLLSDTPMTGDHIKGEGKAGRMGQKLMAVVAEGKKGRVYLPPITEVETIAMNVEPRWSPETELPKNPRWFSPPDYGMPKYSDLFTKRQLLALTTFSDLVQDAREKVIEDARLAGIPNDGISLSQNGSGATAYGDAVVTYLSFAIDRLTDYNSSIATWKPSGEQVMHTFTRQAIPMSWDFTESNVFADKSICWINSVKYSYQNLEKTAESVVQQQGTAIQLSAQKQNISKDKVVSTDPPYYDNIGYADLSDFFYAWLRRSLKPIYPNLFATLAVPKEEELVATPYRHGSKEKAEKFFMVGMTQAIHNLAEQAHPAFPVTIYYAFKQSDTKEKGTVSTGWETFLEAVFQAGFSITGTWPMRSEQSTRMISMGTNSLASSIVLVCQKRDLDSETISRRQFQKELRAQMPEALETMIGGMEGSSPIAPVDLAQAAIGPGIGIFSQYAAVLNQDGSNMSVHDALILINREITDYLNPDSGSFDSDTLFCSAWFDQFGWSSGAFGEANVLAQAKGTTVDGVHQAGVVESGGGKVRLLKWAEYPADWSPVKDNRTPIWEATHQLIRALNQQGEAEAGTLLAQMPERGESIRQLAYHLYTLCERKGWAEDARAYNELIGAWHEIMTASMEVGLRGEQGDLFT